VAPGTVEFAHVQVRPHRKIWRGQPATHAFTVTTTPLQGSPVVLDGTLVQEALFPSWIAKALFILLLLVLAVAAAWFFVLRFAAEPIAPAPAALAGPPYSAFAQARL
jgi:hypothetical protein